ncbi:MAG: hypothetical protein BroJett011_18520 [Chloroflexota bacterium]|nr:MAG: hypothetical protein BroJett011_18520 [Chloroflexota bacterium]
MYGLWLDIHPTAGLTFRRMPSGNLHISTYPFVPPTTLSGWLRRLLLLSAGHYPEIAIKKPCYFALSPDYHVLGAYPAPDPRRSYRIHITQRHGVRFVNHNTFSRVVRQANIKEVYQLHSWEYLLTKQLRGYVLHEEAKALELLCQVKNYGCKLGKEGFAYLENVSDIRMLEKVKVKAKPDVLVPGHDLIGQPADIYTLYRYQFKRSRTLKTDLHKPQSSKIAGFVPLQAGWPAEALELDYYTDGEVYLPASWTEVLNA